MWNKTLIAMLKELPEDYEVEMYDYMNNGKIVSFEVNHDRKTIYILGTEELGT